MKDAVLRLIRGGPRRDRPSHPASSPPSRQRSRGCGRRTTASLLAGLLVISAAPGCSDKAKKAKDEVDRQPPAATPAPTSGPAPAGAPERPRIEGLLDEFRLTSIRNVTLPEGTFEVVPPIVDKLERIGRPVVPYIVPETRNQRMEVRYWAARILGNVGDASVGDALIAQLGDADERVVAQASEALGKVRNQTTIPLVFSAIDGGKVTQVRWGMVLGRPRPEDWDLVPYLIGRLGSGGVFARTSAEILLDLITGKSFGFDPNAPEEDQKKAIVLWESWWRSNRDKRPSDDQDAS